MRLGVIADTRHHRDGAGRLCTIEPVAAQLEQFAAMFDEVVLLVPLWPGPPPAGFRPYRCTNVSIVALRPAGGTTARAKAVLALRVPAWAAAMRRLLRDVDVVHLRAPCNVALLGLAASRLSSRPRAAMYAGNWDGYDGEPMTYRAQRWLLARPSFGGPVTVYTDRRTAASHVVPFFSPSFTLAEWEAESAAVAQKVDALGHPGPVRLVTVGHLAANKNQATIVEAVARLRAQGIDTRLDVVGDGPLAGVLTRRRDVLGLREAVRFHGRLPLDGVRDRYRSADFNVLASRSEGYPKVVAEGMVCGAVPVMSRVPMADALVAGGVRGVTFAGDDPDALAGAIASLASDPARVAAMVAAGRDYTRTVTLDAFGAQLHDILETHWGIVLPSPAVLPA